MDTYTVENGQKMDYVISERPERPEQGSEKFRELKWSVISERPERAVLAKSENIKNK